MRTLPEEIQNDIFFWRFYSNEKLNNSFNFLEINKTMKKIILTKLIYYLEVREWLNKFEIEDIYLIIMSKNEFLVALPDANIYITILDDENFNLEMNNYWKKNLNNIPLKILKQSIKKEFEYFLNDKKLPSPEKIFENQSCPVCLEEYKDNKNWGYNCGHMCCSDCHTKIIYSNNPNCPICRIKWDDLNLINLTLSNVLKKKKNCHYLFDTNKLINLLKEIPKEEFMNYFLRDNEGDYSEMIINKEKFFVYSNINYIEEEEDEEEEEEN